MRYERLDRQLERNANLTKEIRKLLEFSFSAIVLFAIANGTTDIVEFSQHLKTCFKQYIEQAESAAAAYCNEAFHEMSQIESKKQNITKSVNLFLGRC